MDAQRFAILSAPRSGTNYFVSKIGFMPGVLFGWEPFNRGLGEWFDATDLFNALPDAARRALSDRQMRDRSHEEFYYAVFSPRSKIELPGVAALGFKLFPDHSPNLFWKVAADTGMKVIVLERRNRFETFASHLMAVTKKEFTMTEFDEKGLFTFEPVAFDIFVTQMNCIYEGLKVNLELNKTEFIHLYYEDFTKSEDAFVRSCAFIGAPYERDDSSLRKQIVIPARELFSNARIVDEHLAKRYPQFVDSSGARRSSGRDGQSEARVEGAASAGSLAAA